MKFSTIITIIASVAVGSANASVNTSFLRSSINEVLAAASEDPLECYQACATELGRKELEIKKKNNKSKRKVKSERITSAAETCAAEYCSTNRSAAETTCTNSCYREFGKEAAKATNKAIDKAVDDAVKKCEKKCDSCKKDDPDYDSCEKKRKQCEKDCEKTKLSISTKKIEKEVTKKIKKPVRNVDDCLAVCVEDPAAAAQGSEPSEDYDYDYEELKIA